MYDVPGNDLFYSRFSRIRDRAVVLHRTYEEACCLQQTLFHPEKWSIFIVTSRHCDPVRVEKGPGTHCIYHLNHPPLGVFFRDDPNGGVYVLSEEKRLLDDGQAKVGFPLFSLIPGTRYRFNRVSYPSYFCSNGLIGEEDLVDAPRGRFVPKNVTPGMNPYFAGHYYDPMNDCAESCLRKLVTIDGESRTLCCEDHRVDVVYGSDSIYFPLDFSQFSMVPWHSEHPTDHYVSEREEYPPGFEVEFVDEDDLL